MGARRLLPRRRAGWAAIPALVGACALTVSVAAAGPAGAAPARGAARSVPCTQRVVSTVLHVPDEETPNGSREVRVYRPAGPDSRRLPVVYLLPGLPGRDTDFARNGLVEEMNLRECAGQRFVAAVPDGSVDASDGTGAYDSEWADDPLGRFNLESFVTGPLITAVEGTLTRPAALRAIGGFSMGGFAAMSIALRHPTLYRTVLAVAGYFHIDDPDHALGTTTAAQQAHDPDALVSRAAGMHVFLADGGEDTLPVVHGESQRYAALLRKKHVDTTLTLVDGTHTLALFYEALPPALRFWKSRLPRSAG